MNVSLTPKLEAMVREKVETGLYNNASEVVREALRMMEERDRFARLKAAIAKGDESIARGEVAPWASDFMDQVQREADQEDRLGLPISADVTP
jgi:antitoxin ParD1/3/4